MLSFIVGCAIAYLVSRSRVGLAAVLAYGVAVGFIAANASYRDSAGLFPIMFAMVGFLLVREAKWLRKSMRRGVAKEANKTGDHAVATCHRSAGPPGPIQNDELLEAAGLAHAAYLNAVGRELDDVEVTAAALGAFDGAVQALNQTLTDLDMLAQGSAFAFRRLNDLERMQDALPGELGDVLGRAMVSPSLENLRAQAGEFTYMLLNSMPPSSPTVS